MPDMPKPKLPLSTEAAFSRPVHTLDSLRLLARESDVPAAVQSEANRTIALSDTCAIYQWNEAGQYFCPVASVLDGETEHAVRLRAMHNLLRNIDTETLLAMESRDALASYSTATYYALGGASGSGLWSGFDEIYDYAVVFTTEEKAAAYWQKAKKGGIGQESPVIIPVTLTDLGNRFFGAALVDSDEPENEKSGKTTRSSGALIPIPNSPEFWGKEGKNAPRF